MLPRHTVRPEHKIQWLEYDQIGALIGKRLTALQAQYPDIIGDIRADRGAMVAMELVKNRDADQPDPDLVKSILTLAYKRAWSY